MAHHARNRSLFALAALLLISPTASAGEDFLAALSTDSGELTLRADERLFTLFAVFNALGYDAAPVLREHPIAARKFHPIRQRIREQNTLSRELRRRFERHLDAHPDPIEHYVQETLTLDAAFSSSGAAADLAALLREAHASGIGALYADAAWETRSEIRPLLALLNPALAAFRKLTGATLPGDMPLTVIVNLLDGPSARLLDVESPAPILVVGDLGRCLPFEVLQALSRREIARRAGDMPSKARLDPTALNAWSAALAVAAWRAAQPGQPLPCSEAVSEKRVAQVFELQSSNRPLESLFTPPGKTR